MREWLSPIITSVFPKSILSMANSEQQQPDLGETQHYGRSRNWVSLDDQMRQGVKILSSCLIKSVNSHCHPLHLQLLVCKKGESKGWQWRRLRIFPGSIFNVSWWVSYSQEARQHGRSNMLIIKSYLNVLIQEFVTAESGETESTY